MMTALRVLLGVTGTVTVLGVLGSAVRTVILPRGVPARFGRLVFLVVEAGFRLRAGRPRRTQARDDPAGRLAGYRRVDRRYAALGPVYLLLLLVGWLAVAAGGFVGLIEAWRPQPVAAAIKASGSALTTLGIVHTSGAGVILAIAEAAVGLTVIALDITYLPSVYAAFARREAGVAMLSVRGGVPAHAPDLLADLFRADRLRSAPNLFTDWASWFVDLAESHTSFPVLAWYRSPQALNSWPSAAGCVLDAAALCLSTFRPGRPGAWEAVEAATLVPSAELCLLSGGKALRRIADFQGIEPPEHRSVRLTAEQFEQAMSRLARTGFPSRRASEAWPYFAAWRADYEAELLTLAHYLRAAPSPWSTDLGEGQRHRPPVLRLAAHLAGGRPALHPLPPDLARAAGRDEKGNGPSR